MPGFHANWEWWQGRPDFFQSRAKREIPTATNCLWITILIFAD